MKDPRGVEEVALPRVSTFGGSALTLNCDMSYSAFSAYSPCELRGIKRDTYIAGSSPS